MAVGCVTAPPPKEARPPVFYPPLPNPPRLQYLTSFSSAKDLNPDKRPNPLLRLLVGKREEAAPTIEKPYGLAFFGPKLYVVDIRGNGYAVFDLETREFSFVTGGSAGAMTKPINITVDADGTKYVTDTGRNQVLVFDREDQFVRAYGKTGDFKPADALPVGDRIYVADLQHSEIAVLDKQSGERLFSFGGSEVPERRLFWPTNLTLGPDRHLYVTDTGNFRVSRYTLDGGFVDAHGSVGVSLGQFARPKGVALDREGHIYVVDAAFDNVQIFSPDWQLLLFFGGTGPNPENLTLPASVVVDYASAPLFQKYAAPGFKLEYVVAVANQFGLSKVSIFGFGKMEGMDYGSGERAATTPR